MSTIRNMTFNDYLANGIIDGKSAVACAVLFLFLLTASQRQNYATGPNGAPCTLAQTQ